MTSIKMERLAANSHFRSIGHVGGHPHTPKEFDLELYTELDSKYYFIFQLFFPEDHDLEEYTIAFFLNINDIDEENIITNYSTIDKYPHQINIDLILLQQKYYKCFLFKKNTVIENDEILSPLIYGRLVLNEEPSERFGSISARPDWLSGDEMPPPSDQSERPVFAFQIAENFEFKIFADAPGQKEIDYFSDTGFSIRSRRSYKLFAGNEVYFFVYKNLGSQGVFICVQNSG